MTSDALVTSPLGVLAILLASIVVAELLARYRTMKKLGAALIVIAVGALLANLRIIPPATSGNPVYDFTFTYVISGSIFLLLLQVNLGALRRAGGQMIGAFALGAVGVFLGVLIANAVIPLDDMIGDKSRALAGMFTGTYIGGSANFNAVAVAMDVTRDGGLYTATTVVDNVMTDVWILIALALPALLSRTRWFRAVVSSTATAPSQQAVAPQIDHTPLSGTLEIALPLALASLAVWLSTMVSAWLSARGVGVPSVLIVTTLALIAAQVPAFSRLASAHTIGLWAVYLFLAVVGANADLAALAEAGQLTPMLFAYVTIIFVIHAVILIGVGALLKIEPVVLAIASAANIGGSSTAFVVAEAEDRHDLVLPAILIGSIGTALGAYAGFAMTALLR
ncbi:DUF819 domain-containing protein [Marinicaulis aureus]|uniref:DUF819 domain-containing protein n=1 Tax=Hyphococcus aureus TaxID=2666033 RepID=A0ABW1KTG3_9PROT